MGRKTLAEELAELAYPAPTKEIDLEADAFGAGPALEASDEELGANVPGRGREQPRLRGEIALQSKEYSGRKSSRQALFDEPEPSEDDADEASLDTDEDGSLEDASALEDEGSEDRGTPSSENEPAAVARNAAAPMLELTNGIGYANGSGGIDEDEGAALEREYRETRQAEADALAGLKERAEKERRKAAAVASQRRLWNSGLELRILLQRSLQGGNRLPQPEGRSAVAVVDPELDASLKLLAKDAAGAVEDFLDLLGALEEQNTALGRAADTAGVNRARGDADADDDADLETGRQDAAEGNAESEQLWQRLDACYSRFAPYRDASIDRWHRKTVLTTGVAARGGLQALNQSVSTQVATLLQDGGRLLERTRLPKRQRTVLCEVRREEAIEEAASEGQVDEAQEIAATVIDRDPETYDDGEFYQNLLKEFLEAKQVGGSSAKWSSGTKHRKIVDRRASKGRKLRYHVHDKLVNFTAPVELSAPQFASNVFANLFGGVGRR